MNEDIIKMEEKLTYFYNIGAIQAKKLLSRLLELKLVDSTKVKNDEYTLKDLRKILLKKEIFEELPEATKTDLKMQPLRVIPRPIISLIDKELQRIFSSELFKKKIKFDLAGSYIRGKSTSGDIDMVLSQITWDNFKEKINQNSQIIQFCEPFAKGSDKIATLIKVDLSKSDLNKLEINKNYQVYVKIDIFLSNLEDYVFAMLFATGSGTFNIRMRATAKRQGYLLNHHGLYLKKAGGILEKVLLKNEKDIFDILGMSYLEPKNR